MYLHEWSHQFFRNKTPFSRSLYRFTRPSIFHHRTSTSLRQRSSPTWPLPLRTICRPSWIPKIFSSSYSEISSDSALLIVRGENSNTKKQSSCSGVHGFSDTNKGEFMSERRTAIWCHFSCSNWTLLIPLVSPKNSHVVRIAYANQLHLPLIL